MERNAENIIALIATSIVLLFGLVILGTAHDGAYALHGALILIGAGLGLKFVIERLANASEPSELVYSDEVIKWAILACLVWGVIGFFVGDWLACSSLIPPSMAIFPGPILAGFGRSTQQPSFSALAATP